MARGINNKFVKTAAAGSEEELHTLKGDETIDAYNALKADFDDLRTQYVALLAKMDADFADVTNASVDYAASVSPAAATSAAITKTVTDELIPSPLVRGT